MDLARQTQAVLLLTVTLGKADSGAKPLAPKEWGRFAGWLNDRELRPASLLDPGWRDLLDGWTDPAVPVARIGALLSRSPALMLAIEKWQRAGLWVLTRSDADYPKRLKTRLRTSAPAVLFGCGDRHRLNAGGLAVVGSRDAAGEDLGLADDLGKLAAEQGTAIVSGGARGIDERAMLGALENGGTAVGVLADSLLKRAMSRKYRQHLRESRLTLITPFNPEARFHVGNAMGRNKYIYCLADAGVVVCSTPERGGTWNGAIENLKADWVPLWVQPTDRPASGNAALVDRGGRRLPTPLGPDTLGRLTEQGRAAQPTEHRPTAGGATDDVPAESGALHSGGIPARIEDATHAESGAADNDRSPVQAEPAAAAGGAGDQRRAESGAAAAGGERRAESGAADDDRSPVQAEPAAAAGGAGDERRAESGAADDDRGSVQTDQAVSAESGAIDSGLNPARTGAAGSDLDFYALFLRRMAMETGSSPIGATDIEERFHLHKTQVKAWLTRGVKEKRLRKFARPVRYQTTASEGPSKTAAGRSTESSRTGTIRQRSFQLDEAGAPAAPTRKP